MGGVVTGLDFVAALARLPASEEVARGDQLDTHAVRELLLRGEADALTAMAKQRDDKGDA